MKKISVLLIAFLLVASFAFAQETFDVEFEGEASSTFGIDLENQQSGFVNAASADLTVTFVAERTEASEGSGWYGFIEIEIEGENDSFTASVEEARITDGTVYIDITVPDIDQDWAENEIAVGDDGDEVAGVVFRALGFTPFADTFASGITGVSPAVSGFANDEAGITVGYGEDEGTVTDLSLGIVSDGDWFENSDYEYGGTLNVDLDLSPIRFRNRTFLGEGLFTDTDIVFGNATLVGLMLEDTGTSVDVGADITSNFGAFGDGLAWELSLMVGQELAEGTDVHLLAALGEETGIGEDLSLDFGLVFDESTADGLVPNVGAEFAVTLMQAIAPENGMRLGVLLDVEYDADGLNPFAGVGYHQVLDNPAVEDPFLAYEVGVALGSDLHSIENTEFTLRYGSWATASIPASAQLNDDFHPGYVTVEAEISF